MRKINKGEPIPEFQKWVNENKTTNWDDLPPDVSSKVRFHIMTNEQNNLCGYTELPITMEKSHIDHFRKRNGMGFESLTFDWNNFIIASIDDGFGAKYKDSRKSKLTKDDYALIFNPIECGMDDFVEYDTDGKMYPLDENDCRVKRTIDVFNLNDPSLKNRRKSLIKNVVDCFEGGLGDEDIRNCLKNKGFPSVIEWELNYLHSQSV